MTRTRVRGGTIEICASGKPTQTAVTSSGVKPTNHASFHCSVVPVLPATGRPMRAFDAGAPAHHLLEHGDLGVDDRLGQHPLLVVLVLVEHRAVGPGDLGDEHRRHVHAPGRERRVRRRHVEGRDVVGAEHGGGIGLELGGDAHAPGQAHGGWPARPP